MFNENWLFRDSKSTKECMRIFIEKRGEHYNTLVQISNKQTQENDYQQSKQNC